MVDGTLTPCVFLPNPAGNLVDRPYREIWETSPLLRTIRNRDALLSGNCGSCQYKHVCGGCRAVSMSHYGDPMKGDPSCWIVPEASRRSLPVLGEDISPYPLKGERGYAGP
jgi:radical SAM protein with 4Fe4S-binding SPASM domain